MTFIGAAALVLVTGCGSAGGTDAGQDAGAQPDAGPLGCVAPQAGPADPPEDSCPEAEVCDCVTIACGTFPCDRCAAPGDCVRSFPGVYRWSSVRVDAPEQGPGGAPWDPDGGPDLVLRLSVDDAQRGSLGPAPDGTTATFDGALEANFGEGDVARITVIDDDGDEGQDLVFTCSLPVTLAVARSRTLGCEASGGSVEGLLQPIDR
ncbi:MAG: hypothetical protein ACFCGT_05040 [Sandaracinaceae bacterium]